MRNSGRWTLVPAAVLVLLLAAAGPADAKPAYAKAEKKSCSFCHVGKTGDKVFTDAGTYYGKHHTLAGFGEKAKAPKTPAKAAPEPMPVPAAAAPATTEAPAAAAPPDAPAGTESARMVTPMADSGTPCPCGCDCCKMMCGGHHGSMHGKAGMPPMMEKMRGHLEEMKKAVADLRESEKKMEAMKEPEAFRAAVIEHLKMLDDLHESHLRHMDKMMGSRHEEKAEPPHRHGQ